MNYARVPLLLSAFACPGAGQFMQKRWVAGLIYCIGFLIGFFWFMALALKLIFDFYQMAIDPEFEPEMPNLLAMLPSLGIACAFYFANLFDVFFAQQRIAREKQTTELL